MKKILIVLLSFLFIGQTLKAQDISSLAKKADYYFNHLEYKKCLDCCIDLLKLEPLQPLYLYYKILCNYAIGDYEKAIVNCKIGEQSFYDNEDFYPSFLSMHADYLMLQYKYDEALELYKKVLEINPERVYCKLKVATIYSEKGLTKQANLEFKEITKLKEESVYKAIALFYLNRDADAIAQLEKYMQTHDDPIDYANACIVYMLAGDIDKACMYMQESYNHGFSVFFEYEHNFYLKPFVTNEQYSNKLQSIKRAYLNNLAD